MRSASGLELDEALLDLVLQRLGDAAPVRQELGQVLVPRPRKLDRDDLLHGAGA